MDEYSFIGDSAENRMAADVFPFDFQNTLVMRSALNAIIINRLGRVADDRGKAIQLPLHGLCNASEWN